MERFPSGIGQPGFLQKDVSRGFPDWLERVEVPKKGGVRPPSDRLAMCDPAVARQPELHHAPRVDVARAEPVQPDLCVFDLDPAEDEADVLRAASLAVRDVLAELGLPSWVKTSGSKGFHIVVPLDGTSEFDEVAAFADASASCWSSAIRST